MSVLLPDEFVPKPYNNGESPDWHAGVLRAVADQLGVGNDAYYPLHGAANKIEMFRRGHSYDDAIVKEGGAPKDK